VTQSLEEAMVMSDRVAILRKGSIEQIATPDEIYASPKNAFVAGFMGEVNLLSITILGELIHALSAAHALRLRRAALMCCLVRPDAAQRPRHSMWHKCRRWRIIARSSARLTSSPFYGHSGLQW